MSPSEFTSKAVKAIRKQKSEVYIGQSEVWAIYLKRFFPKWFEKKIANVEVK